MNKYNFEQIAIDKLIEYLQETYNEKYSKKEFTMTRFQEDILGYYAHFEIITTSSMEFKVQYDRIDKTITLIQYTSKKVAKYIIDDDE